MDKQYLLLFQYGTHVVTGINISEQVYAFLEQILEQSENLRLELIRREGDMSSRIHGIQLQMEVITGQIKHQIREGRQKSN